jgi:formylglycine-generating enzyme required for sulfatase activity
MRPISLFSMLLTTLSLTAQAPGSVDSVVIPGSTVSFSLSYVPGGSVTLTEGGPAVEVGDFWIGTHEVTQEAYALFQHRDKDSDASGWKDGEFSADAVTRPSPPYTDITFGMGTGGDFPAVSMTQQAALFYCYWLYTKTGAFYRLPTEAEWTHACLTGDGPERGDALTAEQLGEIAWYYDNSEERYRAVGEKKPNALGIYDLIGNVAEWTIDQYAEDPSALAQEQPRDPWSQPAKRYGRTVKGGSFDDFAENCHCRHRVPSTAQWQKRDPQIPKSLWWNTDAAFAGFRLVRPAKQPTREEVEQFFEQAIKW